MKATDVLQQQHRDVDRLFAALEKEARLERKQEIFEELAATLVGHDAIEREIFYPACEKVLGLSDLLGESLVEHGLIEFSVYEADQAQGKGDFDFKLTVLKEVVEQHFEEEERELFPEVQDALEAEQLEELGQEMELRFAAVRAEDFRSPLNENLKRVLARAIRTGKRKAPTSGKPRAHKSA